LAVAATDVEASDSRLMRHGDSGERLDGCIACRLFDNGDVTPDDALPDDIETLKAMLLAERQALAIRRAVARRVASNGCPDQRYRDLHTLTL
jgi:hypothetical protein